MFAIANESHIDEVSNDNQIMNFSPIDISKARILTMVDIRSKTIDAIERVESEDLDSDEDWDVSAKWGSSRGGNSRGRSSYSSSRSGSGTRGRSSTWYKPKKGKSKKPKGIKGVIKGLAGGKGTKKKCKKGKKKGKKKCKKNKKLK